MARVSAGHTRGRGASRRPIRHYYAWYPDVYSALWSRTRHGDGALCGRDGGRLDRWLGMGGDEKQGRHGDFAYSFDMAREAGLHLTSHAGEWGGAASVWQALDDLKVVRIGHGVQAIDDPALVKELVARGTVLEVCPGSNVALGVSQTLATHPIRAQRDAGVKVTVSTDDPPFFPPRCGRNIRRLPRRMTGRQTVSMI